MAKIITIGWATKLLIRDSHFAQFVGLLSNAHMVDGSDTLQTLKPVEFEIKTPHPDLGREISQREKELEKAVEDKNTQWYKEYNKANELTKKLAESEAKVKLLIEQGIKGAFCPQDTSADTSTPSDEELPF